MQDYGKGFRASDLKITDCTGQRQQLRGQRQASTGGSKVIFRVSKCGPAVPSRDINMKGVWLAQQLRSTFVGTISRMGSNRWHCSTI